MRTGSIEPVSLEPGRPRRTRVLASGCVLLFLLVLVELASVASANPVARRVRWNHKNPKAVASFLIAVSNDPWDPAATRYVDAGLPPRISENYAFDIQVDAGAYVSVIAVGLSGQRSAGAPWVEVATVPVTAPGEPLYVQP